LKPVIGSRQFAGPKQLRHGACFDRDPGGVVSIPAIPGTVRACRKTLGHLQRTGNITHQ
jgi:hypothetical protein